MSVEAPVCVTLHLILGLHDPLSITTVLKSKNKNLDLRIQGFILFSHRHYSTGYKKRNILETTSRIITITAWY